MTKVTQVERIGDEFLITVDDFTDARVSVMIDDVENEAELKSKIKSEVTRIKAALSLVDAKQAKYDNLKGKVEGKTI